MNRLVASELLKLRTTPALWVVAGVSAAFAALIPTLASTVTESVGVVLSPASIAEFFMAPAQVTGGAALLLGVLASAGEFRHRTVLTTRLIAPRPSRVLGAQLVAMALVGLALGVVVEIVSGGIGVIGLMANGIAVEPVSYGVPRIAATVPVVVALHAVLGVAVGSLVRNTAGVVGATLIWVFVIEGVLPVVTRHPELAHWLPGGTVPQVLADAPVDGALAPAAAGALLLGYVVLLVGTAAAVGQVREL